MNYYAMTQKELLEEAYRTYADNEFVQALAEALEGAQKYIEELETKIDELQD